MTYILFCTALLLSATAGYYSIMGLIAIFAAAPIPIAIMGTTLEVAKIVTVTWLHNNWKTTSIIMKAYFITAVTVLMLLTSMAIFGFLSKAHLEHSTSLNDVELKLSVFDDKIKSLQQSIEMNRKVLMQMDNAVDQLMIRSTSEDGALRASNLRRSQQRERGRILSEIQSAEKEVSALSEQASPLRMELSKVESKVGPLKYVAALFYGDDVNTNSIENSVRIVILMIIFVFDPLAVLLFIAYSKELYKNSSFIHNPKMHYTPPENSCQEGEQKKFQEEVSLKSNILLDDDFEICKTKEDGTVLKFILK